MIAEAKGILSKSVGSVSASGSTVKVLASAHPVALGVVLGISAYYAVNKYLLNQDIEMSEVEEPSDHAEEEVTTQA